jgi:hypothetical protein
VCNIISGSSFFSKQPASFYISPEKREEEQELLDSVIENLREFHSACYEFEDHSGGDLSIKLRLSGDVYRKSDYYDNSPSEGFGSRRLYHDTEERGGKVVLYWWCCMLFWCQTLYTMYKFILLADLLRFPLTTFSKKNFKKNFKKNIDFFFWKLKKLVCLNSYACHRGTACENLGGLGPLV